MEDKINSVISLLNTNNIVAINMLLDAHCITDELLLLALKQFYSNNHIRDFNLILTLIEQLEMIIDKEIINRLFYDLVIIYSENDNVFSTCFIKLVDMGANIETGHELIDLSANLFFYYISKNDQYIDISITIACMGAYIDPEICDWAFEKFMSSCDSHDTIDICRMATVTYQKQDKSYFEKLMQIIYDKSMNDVVMLNILARTCINDYNMKYISDCNYREELIFFDLIRQIKNNEPKIPETIKLKLLLKQSDAKKIYSQIIESFYNIHGKIYDDMINNIILLMNMFYLEN